MAIKKKNNARVGKINWKKHYYNTNKLYEAELINNQNLKQRLDQQSLDNTGKRLLVQTHISQLKGDLSLQEGIVQLQREHMVKLRNVLKLAKDGNDNILNYLSFNVERPLFGKPRVRITDEYEKVVKALEHLSSVLSMNNTTADDILKLAQNQVGEGGQQINATI